MLSACWQNIRLSRTKEENFLPRQALLMSIVVASKHVQFSVFRTQTVLSPKTCVTGVFHVQVALRHTREVIQDLNGIVLRDDIKGQTLQFDVVVANILVGWGTFSRAMWYCLCKRYAMRVMIYACFLDCCFYSFLFTSSSLLAILTSDQGNCILWKGTHGTSALACNLKSLAFYSHIAKPKTEGLHSGMCTSRSDLPCTNFVVLMPVFISECIHAYQLLVVTTHPPTWGVLTTEAALVCVGATIRHMQEHPSSHHNSHPALFTLTRTDKARCHSAYKVVSWLSAAA